MTASYVVATADMFGVVRTVWPAVETLLGYAPKLLWQDMGIEESPDGSKVWARVSRRTIDSRQDTLSTCVGAPGQVRYTEIGLLFVQLFAPLGDDKAHRTLPQVAQIIRNALRRKSTDNTVWFRNARIDDGLAPENRLLRMNVVAEFTYDEIT